MSRSVSESVTHITSIASCDAKYTPLYLCRGVFLRNMYSCVGGPGVCIWKILVREYPCTLVWESEGYPCGVGVPGVCHQSVTESPLPTLPHSLLEKGAACWVSASNSVIPTPKMLSCCKRGDAKKYCVEAEKSKKERLRGMKCDGRGGVCTVVDLGDDSGPSVVLHSWVIYTTTLCLLHHDAL